MKALHQSAPMPFKIDRAVPVDARDLLPNPWNPNRLSGKEQRSVDESLQLYGQFQELVVRPHPKLSGKYQILDGEHRHKSLTGTVYVNVIHGLTDAEAKKLTIVADAARGNFEQDSLANLLGELSKDLGDALSIGLPYDQSELDELLKSLQQSNGEGGTGGGRSNDDGNGDDDGVRWVTVSFQVPEAVRSLIYQAKNKIEDEIDRSLHPDDRIAIGQVVEILVAEYLAG